MKEDIYDTLCPGVRRPRPRYAAVRTLFDPRRDSIGHSVLDHEALVLYFPAPGSVTGEDVLELHVHGGTAVVQAVLAAIPHAKRLPSAHHIRYAEPGEFTKRAFFNNRLDLVQVEALGDTLAAVTEQQRRLSAQGRNSGLSKLYEEWRQLLLAARSEMEALIDFSEDQHFDESPAALTASVAAKVHLLRKKISLQRDVAMQGELLRGGIDIALLGAPNAGKSSLMNCILQREVAIVSREEGTTRDIIEVGVDIAGWYCRLSDMAGLREDRPSSRSQESQPVGEVEREGIRRAKSRALASDLVIVMLSAERADGDGEAALTMDREVMETAAQCARQGVATAIVVNKLDLLVPNTHALPDRWIQQIVEHLPTLDRGSIFGISCKRALASTAGDDDNDAGHIHVLLKGLTAIFRQMTALLLLAEQHAPLDDLLQRSSQAAREVCVGATRRQGLLLGDCLRHLDDFGSQVQSSDDNAVDMVVAAESLRAAADCLAKITGKGEAGDMEEVLGAIFEKCVAADSFVFV
ncbi:MAG: mitochondrial splicing system protein [Phylliscum demangeonii]|nr:MAG: mitochondrial splicing system protein [Phylliscum demangeonii]